MAGFEVSTEKVPPVRRLRRCVGSAG